MIEVIEARDLDATLSLMAKARGVLRIRGLGEEVSLRMAHGSVGPVDVDRVTFSGIRLDADLDPAGTVLIGQMTSGAVGFRAEGTERWYTKGEIYLASQPRAPRTTLVRGGEHEQVAFSEELLGQVADTAPARKHQRVRFTGYEPVSAQAAQIWKDGYDYIRSTVLTVSEAAGWPLLAASSARLLVSSALTVFPNNALTDPTIEDRHDAHTATLRRAVAFVDEHAHTDISIADIAAAAHVTTRAIQLAFRRHLGITPMAYLRRVRLSYAHTELINADPAITTVTSVAYRWGFPSASRFTAQYRQVYGVTPRQTLHAQLLFP